jgi:hypothetical protein
MSSARPQKFSFTPTIDAISPPICAATVVVTVSRLHALIAILNENPPHRGDGAGGFRGGTRSGGVDRAGFRRRTFEWLMLRSS